MLHRARPLEALIPPNTEELIRARVAGTWAFRTRAEIEATARFARIATELAGVGATDVVVQGAREASEDEARHRELCAKLAEEWGDTNARDHFPPRERIGRSDMDPRDRLLWEMVAVCCVSETMNTSLMTRCMEVAKDPEIHTTLRELLKDEVRHARLGWAHLAAERAAGRGAFLADVLPLLLEASIEPGFLEGTLVAPWTDAMYDYGELPSPELVQIFVDTLNLVVFKGLDAVGVDTSKGRAWLEERTRSAAPPPP
ncbi:MAG TPA: ferritin-like domain-containing protein [Polyangiaceae bacterium]|nr:ferritin-like domain-containing protein [Polyangiaceae bacterium]